MFPGPILDAPEILISPTSLNLSGDVAEPLDDTQLTLAEIEDRHIQRVLDAQQGNQVAAARVLGISRSTLRRKLNQSD